MSIISRDIKPISASCVSLVVALGIAMCLIIILGALLSAKRREESPSSSKHPLSIACRE